MIRLDGRSVSSINRATESKSALFIHLLICLVMHVYYVFIYLFISLFLCFLFHEYLNIRLNFKKDLVELITKLQVYRNVIG